MYKFNKHIIIGGYTMANNVKYDEAAHSTDRVNFTNIPLEKLIEEKKDAKKYANEYKNNLYCPECRIAKLTLVNGERYHLRAFPNAHHSDNCYKGFDVVKPNIFDEFIAKDVPLEFIKKRISAAISKLLKGKVLSHNPMLVKIVDSKCMTDDITEQEAKRRKNIRQIPNKSITAPFELSDYNVFMLFYGKVDVKLEERKTKAEEKIFYVLKIFKQNSNTELCSISIRSNIVDYVIRKCNLTLSERKNNVCIAFVSQIKKNGNFKNATLLHSDFLSVEDE